MSTKADDKVFIVVNKDGIPMYGTKVCSNKGSATRSMAPHLDAMLRTKIGYNGPLADIHNKANPGYGVPKTVHDQAIDDLVDEVRSNYNNRVRYQVGNKSVTRRDVEDYNVIIKELTDNWHVAEVGQSSPYKVLKIDLCEDCGGWYDVRYANNQATKRLCRNCR